MYVYVRVCVCVWVGHVLSLRHFVFSCLFFSTRRLVSGARCHIITVIIIIIFHMYCHILVGVSGGTLYCSRLDCFYSYMLAGGRMSLKMGEQRYRRRVLHKKRCGEGDTHSREGGSYIGALELISYSLRLFGLSSPLPRNLVQISHYTLSHSPFRCTYCFSLLFFVSECFRVFSSQM
jgi:hypothetical protein